MYISITTKVVPASREALEKFSKKDLRDYAKDIGLDEVGRLDSKDRVIDALIASGKATLCASLGN